MYAWLWGRLPGPWPAKAALSAVLLVAVVALLFTTVFPWLEPRLPFGDATVQDGATTGSTASPSPGG